MFQRFFVPLDGSPRAEKAIPVAAKLAHTTSGTLVLARVIVPLAVEGRESNIIANETRVVQDKEISEARSYLKEIAEQYKQELEGLQVVQEVIPTHDMVSSTLLSMAQQDHADLIVMCSRGESRLKRWMFGSIAQSMMRRSPLPVLVLNEHEKASALEEVSHPLRLLVALDGSPFSEAILPSIGQFLALFPTPTPHEVHLLRVIADPPALGNFGGEAYAMAIQTQEEGRKADEYLQEIVRRLAPEAGRIGFVVTTSVVERVDPALAIVRQTLLTSEQGSEAQAAGYDLIAMATHGRSGVKRVLLGSVTEKVFGSTPLPLLIVCPVAEGEGEKVGEKIGKTRIGTVTSG